MSLQICIMTPDQIFWDEKAEEIILPTNTGQMGVLTKHAPLITALDIGVMSVRQENSWDCFALMNGFASIQNDKVTILVNSAESKNTIDSTQAEKDFLEAQDKEMYKTFNMGMGFSIIIKRLIKYKLFLYIYIYIYIINYIFI